MKAFGRIGMKICGDRPLRFFAQPAIMSVQRVAFLRKSGCRSAARLFHSSANRVAEMRKSGFEGLAHFLFLERRGLLWIQEISSWGRSAWAG